MDIGSLKIFCTVVETGSFSAAARALSVAPSTVTKHIQTLEHALERALIQRTTRQLNITEEGNAFYEQCRVALDALTAAVGRKVTEQSSAISGRLRISAPPSLSTAVIGPSLAVFMRRYSNVDLEFIVTAASDDLIAEGIDIAIRIDDQPSAKYPAILLGRERRVFCASPEFIHEFGVPMSPEDLKDFPCLVNIYSVPQRAWPVRQKDGDSTIQIKGSFSSNNGDVIKTLCLAGTGIGLFSLSSVVAEIQQGQLVEILPNHQAPQRAIYAQVPHQKYMSEVGTAFIEFVREVLSPNESNARDHR